LETQTGIEELLSNSSLTDEDRQDIMKFKEEFDSHKANISAAREDALNVFRRWAKRLEE